MSKNLPLALAICAAIGAGALAGFEANRATRASERDATLTAQLQEKEAKLKTDAEAIERLTAENKAFNEEAAALRAKLAAASKTIAPALADTAADAAKPATTGAETKKKTGLEGFLGTFMKDPKMKEMVRQQQGAVMKQLYADFVKSHNLSPQQADAFFKLLSEKQMDAVDESMSAMNGGKDEEPKPDPAEKARLAAERDRQMAMLLGNTGFSDYHAYEKTAGERMVLNSVRQQLAANSAPLDDTQAKSLLDVMTEERARTPQTGLESTAPGDAHAKLEALAGSKGDEYFQAQADMNQRVLNRAAAIMKPEQLTALENFQKQQLEMQKLGVEMTRKMMSPDNETK